MGRGCEKIGIRLDFDWIFQDFHFEEAILNVPRAVEDGLLKMKRQKRPRKQPELRFFHSLA